MRKDHHWSRGERIAVIGLVVTLVVAVIIGVSAFFVPEVRQFLHLEKPPEPALATTTRSGTPQPNSPIQNPEPQKQKTPKPKVKIEQHGNRSGAVGGSISQGPCSNLQIGGNGNQSTVNCSPPPCPWKALKADDFENIGNQAKKSPTKLYTSISPNNADAAIFAGRLLPILSRVGWDTSEYEEAEVTGGFWGFHPGITITMRNLNLLEDNSTPASTLKRAIESTGLHVHTRENSSATGNELTLWVGQCD